MVLKVYGSPASICTKRVALVLHEKKVSFELHVIDLAKGENKSPEYLSKQPFGQIPYIDDDGFILYESRAIAAYIAAKYPEQGTRGLIPKPKRFSSRPRPLSSPTSMMFDMTTNQAVVDDQVGQLAARLDVYDQILSKQKYVAGNELTLADLYHLPYASLLGAAGSDVLEKRPNFLRWYKVISSRASWQAIKDGVKGTA
ncbi:unnamed protein product [Cyclocybe aegerita]|uniref:glutathione transferase n=1 Tax=Cyclocybe aegerita TaxID=1973307 RepID=A0A8S0VYE2_CYCAE|nr:unnamed protein product [Cyclocybe aegerita]